MFANAGAFGGFGNNLQLVSNDEIQMVSEDIRIKLVPSKFPVTGNLKHFDEARYDCYFLMRNLSDKSTTVQMGFPLSDDNFMARAKGNKIASHEFKVYLNDKEISANYHEKTIDKKFVKIFLWDAHFAPKEEKHLRVSYKTFGYIGVGTLRKEPYDWSLFINSPLQQLDGGMQQSFGYVTLTGNSWRGKIEIAKFSIDVGEFERYLQQRGYLAENKNQKQNRASTINTLLRNGILYRHLTPNNWKPSADGERLEMHCAPFEPKENINITYHFTTFPKDVDGLNFLLNFAKKYRYKKPFTKEDKRLVCDAILEFYGIKTNNKNLKILLDNSIWYPVKNPPKLDENLKSELLK